MLAENPGEGEKIEMPGKEIDWHLIEVAGILIILVLFLIWGIVSTSRNFFINEISHLRCDKSGNGLKSDDMASSLPVQVGCMSFVLLIPGQIEIFH